MATAVNSTPEPVVQPSLYNYVPTLWICALFIALFSLTTILHIGQAIRTRLWFLLPTACLAGVGEIIGWIARLRSSHNPIELNPFLIQISTTIIAPTPLVAANFVILGQLIARLGSQYSRLNAMWYTIVFCSCDVIALIVQAVGGAKASFAVQNGGDPGPGGHIMLGGIAFQMVAITIYLALASEFVLRYLWDRPLRASRKQAFDARFMDRKTKLMLLGLTLSTVLIFIRSVYRTIELANGWSGRIISTQVYFNVLDGGMITAAMFTLNAFHPGFLLGPWSTWIRDGEQPSEKAGADTGEETRVAA